MAFQKPISNDNVNFDTLLMNFNGDPNLITIHGQSAGGSSMGLHLTNKNSSALIQNVIMQSNPFGIPMKTRIEERVQEFYRISDWCREWRSRANSRKWPLILYKAKIQSDLFAAELHCLVAGSVNATCLRAVFKF